LIVSVSYLMKFDGFWLSFGDFENFWLTEKCIIYECLWIYSLFLNMVHFWDAVESKKPIFEDLSSLKPSLYAANCYYHSSETIESIKIPLKTISRLSDLRQNRQWSNVHAHENRDTPSLTHYVFIDILAHQYYGSCRIRSNDRIDICVSFN
jgi:hypothetical protein